MKIRNRKARFRYQIFDTFEVGLMLTGTEVKSIREGKANIGEAYLIIKDDELFLINAHISPYSHGNIQNHEPTRTRKCLAHRHELDKMKEQIERKGLTLVPLAIYTKKQWIKCQVGIGKGKKLYDKRRDSKERDIKRETAKALKRSQR